MVASVLLLVIAILHVAHGLIDYVVYPVDKRNVSACSQVNVALVKLCGQSRVQVYRSPIRQVTEFWVVKALETEKNIILHLPGVDDVLEDEIIAQNNEESSTNTSAITGADDTRSNKASPQLKEPNRSQRDAPQDLDLVSWPPGKRLPFIGKMQKYVYDVSRGRDTYIYIIDNGLNDDNTDFESMPWPPEPDEWHYAYGVYKSTTDDNLAGHGSCVASKAAGWKTGVSKNSHLVVMKSLPTLSDVNFAFAAALDDIIAKRRQRKAVVVYPATSIQTFRVGTALPRNWESVHEIIRELFTMNVVVVTAAGNSAARSSALDTVPAIWALDADFPLIVAGAVKLDGSISRFSQGAADIAQVVWAPGENIVCANGPSAQGTVVRSGTSFAAAMVAGLAAYLMEDSDPSFPGSIPTLIRSRLFSTSRPIYPLKKPPVIWNGQNGALGASVVRDSNSTVQLVSSSSSSSSNNATEGQVAAVA